MQSQILQLDIQGTPQAWISPEQAALHLSTDDVAWAVGESDPLTVLRGGYNARLQRQSSLAIPPIIALRGQARVNLFDVEPTVTRRKLFVRDRFMCAYCGGVHPRGLTRDHIVPLSRGGKDTWLNVCASCSACNARKGAKLLEELGWELLYLPYAPNHQEGLLLENRRILGDQMELLKSMLPKHSRLAA